MPALARIASVSDLLADYKAVMFLDFGQRDSDTHGEVYNASAGVLLGEAYSAAIWRFYEETLSRRRWENGGSISPGHLNETSTLGH